MNKKFIFCILCVLCFLHGHAQITFTEDSEYVWESYENVAVGNLNNDDLPDIVLGTIRFPVVELFPDSLEQVIEIYHQTHAHTFTLFERFKYDTSADTLEDSMTSIEIADMNNDGLNDLLVAFGGKVAIYAQDSTSHFHLAYQYYPQEGIISQVRAVKLFHDSLPGIAFYSLYTFQILKPVSSFTYQALTLQPPPGSVVGEFVLGDFNNDNLQDIAVSCQYGQSKSPVYIYYQDSIQGFSNNPVPLDSITPFFRCNGIGAGDLNNDGLTDIVATFGGNRGSLWTPYIGIYYQDTANHTVNYSLDTISKNVIDIPSEVQIRDLNNDGLNDLTVLHDGWATLSVYEQLSGGKGLLLDSDYFDFNGSTHVDSYAFIDLNDDGKMDIISVAAGEIKYYYNTSPVGIKPIEEINDSYFSLFPNPSRNNLFIRLNGNMEPGESIKSITVLNSLGQKLNLNVIRINQFEYKINTQSLTNGLYLLIIEANKQQFTKRFIKYE